MHGTGKNKKVLEIFPFFIGLPPGDNNNKKNLVLKTNFVLNSLIVLFFN